MVYFLDPIETIPRHNRSLRVIPSKGVLTLPVGDQSRGRYGAQGSPVGQGFVMKSPRPIPWG